MRTFFVEFNMINKIDLILHRLSFYNMVDLHFDHNPYHVECSTKSKHQSYLTKSDSYMT